jgi:hypothetical protein
MHPYRGAAHPDGPDADSEFGRLVSGDCRARVTRRPRGSAVRRCPTPAAAAMPHLTYRMHAQARANAQLTVASHPTRRQIMKPQLHFLRQHQDLLLPTAPPLPAAPEFRWKNVSYRSKPCPPAWTCPIHTASRLHPHSSLSLHRPEQPPPRLVWAAIRRLLCALRAPVCQTTLLCRAWLLCCLFQSPSRCSHVCTYCPQPCSPPDIFLNACARSSSRVLAGKHRAHTCGKTIIKSTFQGGSIAMRCAGCAGQHRAHTCGKVSAGSAGGRSRGGASESSGLTVQRCLACKGKHRKHTCRR